MTTATANMMVGACACGTEVRRELPPDTPANAFMRKFLALRPLMCDRCVERDEAEHQAEEERRAEQALAARVKARFKDSGMPAKHRVSLDSLDHPQPVIAACKRWAELGGGLLLEGEIGRGKTTLAGAAAARMLESRSVRWTSAPLLFARLGSGFDSEQRAWALDVLQGRTALVLDDIDKARPTEYGAEQVFLAVDQRVEHELPLLVTTNLSPGQLAEKWPEPFGPAIASRLVGYCELVRVEGDDRRLA